MLFWFRNDLRLHEQRALQAALDAPASALLPVVCLPRAQPPPEAVSASEAPGAAGAAAAGVPGRSVTGIARPGPRRWGLPRWCVRTLRLPRSAASLPPCTNW
ncbi:MAG: deoxyribodipyrimidine photo-lyase [Giesbergeria sp.]